MGKQSGLPWTPPAGDTPVENNTWAPPSTDEEVKKKVNSPGFPSGLDLSGRGLTNFQNTPQSVDLSPVPIDRRGEVRQEQRDRATKLSKQLSEQLKAANPELKKELQKIPNLFNDQGEIKAVSQEDQDHYAFMQSPVGKLLTPIAYLGSKATHGTLQIAKGVAHLATMANNPAAVMSGVEPTDAFFDKADEFADMGLTKGDLSRIDDGNGLGNHLLKSAGMMAEFAPGMAGGEVGATKHLPKLMLYLQGVGMGKEQADKMPGLNPLAKEALIQGSGVVNLALAKFGDNLFGKGVSSAVKDKVALGIAADVIKENAGKDLTYSAFKDMLEGQAKSVVEKFDKAPAKTLQHYVDAAKTFAKLDVGNFAVHKGVDALQEANGDKPVFNETVGDLAENLNRSMTESVPTFGSLGGIAEATKLIPGTVYENEVVKSVMDNPSPENVDAIKQQLHDHGFQDGDAQWTPEEMDATFKHVDAIATAAKTLPRDIEPNKRSKAVGLVLDRNTLQDKLSEIQQEKKGMDAAIQDIPTAKEQYLTDKIDQANDKLRDIVSNKRTTYSKGTENEEGKFFKTTDGKKEEISESRYNLESIEREAKTKTNEQSEPNQEVSFEPPADEAIRPEEVIDQVDETNGDKEPVVEPVQEDVVPDAAEEVVPENIEPVVDSNESVDINEPAKEAPVVDEVVPDKPLEVKNEVADEELSREDYDRKTIEKETDPVKLAAKYHTETSYPDTIEKAIIDYFGPGKINEKDYRRITGLSAKDGAGYWLDTKNSDKTDIYTHAEILSDELGVAITPDDIVETISRYSGRKNFEEANKSDIQRMLEDKYLELTGKKLTPYRAEKSFNKVIKLNELEKAQMNEAAKEIGITEEDFDNYENYRKETQHRSGARRAADLNAKKISKSANEQGGRAKESGRGESSQGKNERKQVLTEEDFARKLELRKKFSGQFNDITRIPTLLADKEFREYAGLVFKEAAGEFKAFAKDLIETVGEEIKEHLPALWKELGGKDEPIGISKAETTKQREIRGLEGFSPAEKTTLSEMFDNGKAAVVSGEIDPRELANDVAKKPRNLTKTEVNALLYDRMRINKETDAVSAEIDQRLVDKDSNPEAMQTLFSRRRYLDEQLSINEEAVSKGARENSLALNAMKGMINTDYSYNAQRSRMRSILGGELTPEMEAELTKYKDLLDEANRKLADYEYYKVEKRAQKVYDREVVEARKVKKAGDLESINKRQKAVVDEFLTALKKQRSVMNDAPKAVAEFIGTAAPFIKKMVPILLEKGIVEFKDVVATIHETFAEHIDGLTERDVMDAISGKYDQRKETKSELVDQRNNIIRLARLNTKLEDLQNGVTKEKSERKIVKTREDIAELQAQIKDIEKQMGPTAEERNKESLKRRLDNINQRINSGDFEQPAAKNSVDVDAESIALQAKVKKAQNNYNAMAERLGNYKKNKFERALDTYTAIRRAMLLSGVKTLGKLYSFAALRSVNTPMEEVVNAINVKLPGLKKIAERSPRFGGGLDMKAEALAITTRWSKATLKDSWVEVLKTGSGELDRLYGKNGIDKDYDLNPSALEFFGRLHGSFKNSTKRAEFFRSFQKRLEFASSEGKDVNDPNVQFALAQQAYVDGKRAILMSDNILVDKGYKNLLRGLEGDHSMSGKTVATAIRALFPIVKIPTNYVLETYDVVTGAVPGFSRATPYIVKAMMDGADSLEPKQADMVMRTLAKGQIGLAAMLIAYNNPQAFGGYYSGKRSGDDLKAGDIYIGGVHIPHFMSHNPIFEAMQIAATMRRAIDEANGNGAPEGILNTLTTNKKNEIEASARLLADKNNPNVQMVEVKDGKKYYNVFIKNGKLTSVTKEGGAKEGSKNAIKGVLEQIPFTSAGDLINNDKTAGNIAGEMARNQVEPRLLQEAAEFTDTDANGEKVKRDPQNFTDQLKVGVPGLREQVGEKKQTTDKKVRFIKLENGTEYELNDNQIKEREELNADYIKDNGEKLRKKFTGRGLTAHDIELRIDKAAAKYSKRQMLKRYKNGAKYNFEEVEE